MRESRLQHGDDAGGMTESAASNVRLFCERRYLEILSGDRPFSIESLSCDELPDGCVTTYVLRFEDGVRIEVAKKLAGGSVPQGLEVHDAPLEWSAPVFRLLAGGVEHTIEAPAIRGLATDCSGSSDPGAQLDRSTDLLSDFALEATEEEPAPEPTGLGDPALADISGMREAIRTVLDDRGPTYQEILHEIHQLVRRGAREGGEQDDGAEPESHS